jgi:hypothetical protein
MQEMRYSFVGLRQDGRRINEGVEKVSSYRHRAVNRMEYQ